MPNWLRSRWSCWSSSLLSNSMLSREWWEEERPIWRRLFSSNSRCSAWISASFKRLVSGGEGGMGKGPAGRNKKHTRLDSSPQRFILYMQSKGVIVVQCTLSQPPRCTPAPRRHTRGCWWEEVRSGTDGSPPQPPPRCCGGWHGNACSSGLAGCHDVHSSRQRSRWPQPALRGNYSSITPKEDREMSVRGLCVVFPAIDRKIEPC